MGLTKYWIAIPVVLAIILIVSLYTTTKRDSEAKELKEYREYLLGLSAEDVIVENFKNRTDKNLPKMKDLATHDTKSSRSGRWNVQRNLIKTVL